MKRTVANVTTLWIAALVAGCLTPVGDEAKALEGPTDEVAEGAPAPSIEGDHNVIRNSGFEEGSAAPWAYSTSGNALGKATIEDGAYCMDLKASGDTAWDAQVRHRQLQLRKGHKFLVEFTAWANADTQIRPKVGSAGPPYDEYWASIVDVSTEPQRYVGHFTMESEDDLRAELTFQLGGPLVGPNDGKVKVCFDDISLSDPEYTPPPPPPKLSWIRVNQVGYYPKHGKRATMKAIVRDPQTWQLLDANDQVVDEGQTMVFGEDKASGDLVHIIDFTRYKTAGEGYRLRVNDQISLPFDISNDIYKQMKFDAVHFFYHQRSGIEIKMPYARDPKWERGAGHMTDANVKCLPELDCGFEADVVGGWYDAGDHGKYVVNGGISVWTLLNLYERNKFLGKGEVFKDGTLPIPEAGNGVNDLLDEARWELEWEMRMQIGPDKPKWQGLAFHKLHEVAWSPMPLSPPDAKVERFLHRPSTASTLNLAANAAQCARIWKDIDPAFSKKCLVSAERAWEAAQKYPDLLAPGSDNVGGGPYDDLQLHDEYYWAAVELYLATKKNAYAEYAKRSQDFLKVPAGAQSAMNWQLVGVLGTISLATVPGFDAETVKKARQAIVKTADAYAQTILEEGYRTPLSSGGGNTYPWGSNSFVVNNLIMFGLAYDFTKNEKYLTGAIDGLDYLLGRNPMSQSYVTGYGENPLKNPHHRFFSIQLDPAYPEPPPGIVSGGPNSALQDPYAQKIGLPGCPPQKCFVDHIESWSTNEITINWNAPFAWGLTFVDEAAR